MLRAMSTGAGVVGVVAAVVAVIMAAPVSASQLFQTARDTGDRLTEKPFPGASVGALAGALRSLSTHTPATCPSLDAVNSQHSRRQTFRPNSPFRSTCRRGFSACLVRIRLVFPFSLSILTRPRPL
jgi:hypothetical protein